MNEALAQIIKWAMLIGLLVIILFVVVKIKNPEIPPLPDPTPEGHYLKIQDKVPINMLCPANPTCNIYGWAEQCKQNKCNVPGKCEYKDDVCQPV